jgi:hypothetical protein
MLILKGEKLDKLHHVPTGLWRTLPNGWRVSGDRHRAKRGARVRCTRGLGGRRGALARAADRRKGKPGIGQCYCVAKTRLVNRDHGKRLEWGGIETVAARKHVG